MAINNLVHDLPADANDLNYADSNLTLFQHELFETNNEWAIVRNYETQNKIGLKLAKKITLIIGEGQ